MNRKSTSISFSFALLTLCAGCGPSRLPSNSSAQIAESRLDDCQPDAVTTPAGLPAITLLVRPVSVQAAVPGRAKMYGEALRTSVFRALQTSSAVTLAATEDCRDKGGTFAIVDVTITQFRVATEGRKDQSYGQIPMVLTWQSGTNSQNWRAVAFVNVVLDDGTAMSWEVTDSGQSVSRVTDVNPGVAMGTIAWDKSQETSHSAILCRLGRQIAQNLLNKVESHRQSRGGS